MGANPRGEIEVLIIEYKNNGRNVVKLRKDWTPARIGRPYTPPKQSNVESRDAFRIQTAYLNKGNCK
jgi:hypothetical protein